MLLPSSGLNYIGSETGSSSKAGYKEGGQKIQGEGSFHIPPVPKETLCVLKGSLSTHISHGPDQASWFTPCPEVS